MNNINEYLQSVGISSAITDKLMKIGGFEFESPIRLGGVDIVGHLKVGAYTYLHDGFLHNTEIGRYCSIGKNLVCLQPNHPIDWLSTHPFQYNNISQTFGQAQLENLNISPGSTKKLPRDNKKTRIGNDVWIGTDVTISHGVRIGSGAIIGAKSMVTRDVPAYAIVGGNPARLIRYRFDEQVINKLLSIEWWNYDLVQSNFKDYDDVNKFIDFFNREELVKLNPKLVTQEIMKKALNENWN